MTKMLNFAGHNNAEACSNCDDQRVMLQFSSQVDSLQRLARLAEIRQRVISHNIANVNTPNFKTLDLEQITDLASMSVNSSRNDHTHSAMIERPGLTARADGNNVDIDVEVAESNKNDLLHHTYVLLLNGQINNLRRAMQI